MPKIFPVSNVKGTPPRLRPVGAEVRLLVRWISAVSLLLVVANVGPRVWLLMEVKPRVDLLRSVAAQLDDVHAGMVDEETAVRGYLATGSRSFLEPYDEAVPRVDSAAGRVAELLPSGGLSRDLLRVELARQRWHDAWAVPATTRMRAGEDRREELATFMAEGKALFDAYRQAHQTLDRDVDSAIREAARQESAWLVGSGLFQLAVALGVVVVALLGRRRVTHLITGPLEELAGAVRQITRGDLDARVDLESGPLELVELGEDVTAMASALRDQRTTAVERQHDLDLYARRLGTVLGAAREVAGSLSLRYVLRSVADAATSLAGDRARIWLLEEDDNALTLAFDTAAGPEGPVHAVRVTTGTGLVGRVAKYGRPLGPEPLEDGGSALAVPLIVGGRVVGTLECLAPAGGAMDDDVVEILEALAGHAAGAVASARLHERTMELAVTDALTELPNRRAFEAEFAAEVDRAQRYARPLSVISVDLDHFKALNDRYGHAYGDLALQQTSAALRETVRTSDRVYRLGGEELAVVCPETTAADAVVLAERLRSAVEAAAGPDAPVVTASMGVAEMPTHARAGNDLLAVADAALYSAKHAGRNRVVAAPALTPA